MSRLRSSLGLLAICVAAIVLAWIGQATSVPHQPTGSSYSTQPDGVAGLYDWADALGASPHRLQQPAFAGADGPPPELLLVQSEVFVSDLDRAAFDEVPKHGGTLVLAGDSVPILFYAASLGVRIDLTPPVTRATSADGQFALALDPPATHRVRAENATPLLIAPNGDWLALRAPYQSGSLVVIATPQPLTNAALRQDATARFVYRELLMPLAGGAIAFDESHHTYAPPSVASPATVNQLLFQTAPGRAVVYVALLVFVFLLLGSRRLGPPVAARTAVETRRTMYEHVQMLGNLYRRAGQLSTVRSTFVQHYSRALARSGHATRLAKAVAQIDAARSERELLEAVAAADNAL